jgi:hypothetical protein
MGCGNRESCRNLFKELNILPLMSQYVLSLRTFMSNNRNSILQILKYTTEIPGTLLTYTYLGHI